MVNMDLALMWWIEVPLQQSNIAMDFLPFKHNFLPRISIQFGDFLAMFDFPPEDQQQQRQQIVGVHLGRQRFSDLLWRFARPVTMAFQRNQPYLQVS